MESTHVDVPRPMVQWESNETTPCRFNCRRSNGLGEDFRRMQIPRPSEIRWLFLGDVNS
jgi:hypothetical protein